MAQLRPPSIRDPERGGILVVSLIALVALLGIGVVTMLSVRSDTSASGNDRFQQISLYAAESGVAAGLDFLRTACNTTTLYSDLVNPANANPAEPVAILGNNIMSGQPGNVFAANTRAAFRVRILNNEDDPGFAAGDDFDGIVLLQSTGLGPDQTRTVLRMRVRSPSCLSQFCATEYAQRGVNARNDYEGACAQAIDLAAGLRMINP